MYFWEIYYDKKDKEVNIMKKNERKWYEFAAFINGMTNTFYLIGLPLLVYEMTESATTMGGVTIMGILPLLSIGLFIGTIVDRFEQKKILQLSAIIQSFLMGILVINYFILNSVFVIYIMAFLISINVQFNKVTNFVIIPQIFEENIKEGNSGISFLNTISELMGPFVASFVLGIVGISALFLINLLSSLIYFIIITFKINTSFSIKEKKSKLTIKEFINDTKEGFISIKDIKVLKYLAIVILISNLADSGMGNLLIYYMSKSFNLSGETVSLIIGISGIGAIIGSIFMRKIKKINITKLIIVGILINNVGVFLLLIKSWIIVPIALMIINFGSITFIISQNTIIHYVATESLLGRINSSFKLIVQLTRPVSIFILMYVAEKYGGYYGIAISTTLTVISTFTLLISRIYTIQINNNEEISNE